MRAGFVTGTRSRSTPSTSDRCTRASAFRPLRPGGTVISSGPGRNPDTPHSTAADLCDTTAPAPLIKHAASARCFHVTGTPASR